MTVVCVARASLTRIALATGPEVHLGVVPDGPGTMTGEF